MEIANRLMRGVVIRPDLKPEKIKIGWLRQPIISAVVKSSKGWYNGLRVSHEPANLVRYYDFQALLTLPGAKG